MPPRRSRRDKVMEQDEYAQFEERLGRIVDECMERMIERFSLRMTNLLDGRKRGRRQNRPVSYSTGVAMEFTGHAPLSRQRSHIRLVKENRLGEGGITIDDSEYAMEYSDPPSYDESAFEDDGEYDKEYSHPPLYDKVMFEEDGVGKEYSCPPLYDENPFEEEDGAGIEYSTPPVYDEDVCEEVVVEDDDDPSEPPVCAKETFNEEVVEEVKIILMPTQPIAKLVTTSLFSFVGQAYDSLTNLRDIYKMENNSSSANKVDKDPAIDRHLLNFESNVGEFFWGILTTDVVDQTEWAKPFDPGGNDEDNNWACKRQRRCHRSIHTLILPTPAKLRCQPIRSRPSGQADPCADDDELRCRGYGVVERGSQHLPIKPWPARVEEVLMGTNIAGDKFQVKRSDAAGTKIAGDKLVDQIFPWAPTLFFLFPKCSREYFGFCGFLLTMGTNKFEDKFCLTPGE